MNTPGSRRQSKSENKANDATVQIKKYEKLSENFESLKKTLNSKSSHYINYLFSMLGYNYKGKVENPNILHLVSEAYLLSMFEELKKENKNGTENLKYNELLSQMNWIIVQENAFIDNIKILSGIFNSVNPALDNNRIFKMFLVNIQATKNDILKHNENLMKDDNLSKEKFNEIWAEIFNTALNHTLNDFNPSEDKKKSLTMYHLFTEIKETHPASLNLKAYIAEFLKRKHLTDSEAKEITPYLENFFNFAVNNFDELVEEVELFNDNSASLIFKISSLLSVKNFKRIYEKYIEILSSYTENGLKSVRLEQVLKSYKSLSSFVKEQSEQQMEKAQNKYQVMKKWVDSNDYAKEIRDFSFKIYENARKYSEVPMSILDNVVYQPLKGLAFKVTSNGIHILINTASMTQQRASQLREAVVNIIDKTFGEAKRALLGDEPLVKVHSEKDEYVSIELNKKLFVVDPQKAQDALRAIYTTVKQFSGIEIVKSAVSCSVQKIQNAKAYVYDSYRKFLELANEDDEELVSNKKNN